MFKNTLLFITLLVISHTSFAAVLPAGTEIKIRMQEPVNSQLRSVGYYFKALVENAVNIDNKEIIKQGAKASGKVTMLKTANRTEAAEIELMLTNLTIDNRAISVKSYPVAGRGELVYRTKVGTPNLEDEPITASTGEQISNTIPVLTRGNFIELTTGTVVYFILKDDVIYY
ncbi:hypothetical protein E2R68_04590 [Psychromonas sp. RZ22]|uniref:hypothetical protein n=1 Tax=Psychromonas algarum TaxID=2555643 RepID=UPI0010688DB9|nr:hypothetical protein [Psychromonas sp. RZ22]TEW55662.1 hypothetical protein E2R68_04590 [Psychromonas sp. RZ22]